ncbi:hypothetical protein GCM10017778_31670 [Streptomyces vinaceus]|nr:hypothetical protein GCM10017778_31670 [Streptomyces vinaceus]
MSRDPGAGASTRATRARAGFPGQPGVQAQQLGTAFDDGGLGLVLGDEGGRVGDLDQLALRVQRGQRIIPAPADCVGALLDRVSAPDDPIFPTPVWRSATA